jgi:hypothetical protein
VCIIVIDIFLRFGRSTTDGGSTNTDEDTINHVLLERAAVVNATCRKEQNVSIISMDTMYIHSVHMLSDRREFIIHFIRKCSNQLPTPFVMQLNGIDQPGKHVFDLSTIASNTPVLGVCS